MWLLPCNIWEARETPSPDPDIILAASTPHVVMAPRKVGVAPSTLQWDHSGLYVIKLDAFFWRNKNKMYLFCQHIKWMCVFWWTALSQLVLHSSHESWDPVEEVNIVVVKPKVSNICSHSHYCHDIFTSKLIYKIIMTNCTNVTVTMMSTSAITTSILLLILLLPSPPTNTNQW